MEFDGVEHEPQANSALYAIGKPAVVLLEGIHILLVFFISYVVFIQHAVDLEAVAAVDTHLGHNLEMLPHIQVEMGEEKDLGNGHHGLVGTGFSETVTGFPVPFELISFVV